MSPLGLLVTVLGFLVWAYVAIRAVRTNQELVVLALVLTVLGLLASSVLNAVGVEAPGAWAFLATGVLLLLVWPSATHNGGTRE